LTKEEQEKYDAAEVCEKCKKPFDARDCPKVRHHCHVTGKYVGAWCRRCNYLEGKKKLKLVVFFHNLRGYDSHMILRYGLMEIAKLHGKDGNIQQFIIGKSAEKLSSFQFGNFIF
jgi:CRISPR/Cas system-associated protein Cas10 (large subunit of type III CRISPR-Cas system)